jgi:Na+/proline symporter
MIKILGVLFGVKPIITVLFASLLPVTYAMLGGLTAVLWADFILFLIAMTGAVVAAWYALQQPAVDGLTGLLSHPSVSDKLSFFPDFSNFDLVVTLLAIPLLVQWWSVWYPGSEPGGGSYVAQRMLAAKSESHAVGATLFFNFCHYAVRPWPWIIVALASLIVFPDLASLKNAFPHIPDHYLNHDMAYPAMLTFLPTGWAGIVLASLFAAFMSTIATHLNLGSSYLVNDFHRRFVRPKATEKELVIAGRTWTVILMVFACLLATQLKSALDVFEILLQIGAGTGLLFLLRWFWWRINAWSEVAAMLLSFSMAMFFKFCGGGLPEWLQPAWMQLVVGVTITTIGWIIVTFLTPPTNEKTLREFVRRSRAGGPGWQRIVEQAASEGDNLDNANDQTWSVPVGILCTIIGCVSIYGMLFATGNLLYGKYAAAVVLFVISVGSAVVLLFLWSRIVGKQQDV